MARAIVNLTGSLVVEEIDRLLGAYPDGHIYNTTFANPGLRRRLAAFVLSKVRNRYAVLEDNQGRPIYPNFQSASLEKRLHIEEIIKQGIELIIFENNPNKYFN
ncbi:hypothetical protein [Oscillatoria salina]|uniref:hypothetical protein n=1 Tax=Oscillatoria salina TaxID=331517 RepID=UPI0013B61CFE|nr:hypothetical protein [Oscillatoria salina]MBZ8179396.1 hypothetical protein [Oscillatoria salina IIICB1]NET87865.1 hypothetical protein [Kamptonema sp. SIO1D9]